MAPRKRGASAAEDEPVAKRRSSRQAAAAKAAETPKAPKDTSKAAAMSKTQKKTAKNATEEASAKPAARSRKTSEGEAKLAKPVASSSTEDKQKPRKQQQPAEAKKTDGKAKTKPQVKKEEAAAESNERGASEDPDTDDVPAINPEAPRHEGEWYWLMKAEPETRYENGIDVRFSIDDLRAREKPEGWDGIRNYAARNHMRNMNIGDKAFFYHSNCKEPGIVGIMEIVREFSEDKSARRPGTPYYDPQSTRDKPRWSLVHVEFRTKFAVPIGLPELRKLGEPGGPLEQMKMLKQSRLSVSRVSGDEWRALCELADRKAEEAGMAHVTGKIKNEEAKEGGAGGNSQSMENSLTDFGPVSSYT